MDTQNDLNNGKMWTVLGRSDENERVKNLT